MPTKSKSRTTTTTGKPVLVRAVQPGNILRHDVLDPLGLTQTAAATRLGVPVQTVNQIVRGKRAISADMALKLERAFEVSAEFWLRLQSDWDLQQARERSQAA
ncbi:MAG: HigA family addiction module antidote protein [Luteitalea sp.]|nr:HigA family addiction module antidote protein [Luteitalea sp.]